LHALPHHTHIVKASCKTIASSREAIYVLIYLNLAAGPDLELRRLRPIDIAWIVVVPLLHVLLRGLASGVVLCVANVCWQR